MSDLIRGDAGLCPVGVVAATSIRRAALSETVCLLWSGLTAAGV
jgi:hypothetical protein